MAAQAHVSYIFLVGGLVMAGKQSPLVKSSEAMRSKPSSSVSSPQIKPMVFISHDSRDADLAEALSNLFTDASGGMLRSFRSSDRKGTEGIEFGAEWYRAIMEKLDGATDVVALLTPSDYLTDSTILSRGSTRLKIMKRRDRVGKPTCSPFLGG